MAPPGHAVKTSPEIGPWACRAVPQFRLAEELAKTVSKSVGSDSPALLAQKLTSSLPNAPLAKTQATKKVAKIAVLLMISESVRQRTTLHNHLSLPHSPTVRCTPGPDPGQKGPIGTLKRNFFVPEVGWNSPPTHAYR